MLKLKKNINHINEKYLNFEETKKFLPLLEKELNRHMYERKLAFINEMYSLNEVEKLFWKLQKENHNNDVSMIIETIRKLNNKYNL